eukprot:6208101-Pleurochrysis_carterae.AAC.2
MVIPSFLPLVMKKGCGSGEEAQRALMLCICMMSDSKICCHRRGDDAIKLKRLLTMQQLPRAFIGRNEKHLFRSSAGKESILEDMKESILEDMKDSVAGSAWVLVRPSRASMQGHSAAEPSRRAGRARKARAGRKLCESGPELFASLYF